jgi:surface polysaccharide O-acyltransferase-like enzyme
LRGLAIIAVVFLHNTPGGLAQVFVRPFLNFCVGLFLFLSGLLSSRQKWNPMKRIRKVMYPYIIWTFIYIVMGHFHEPPKIPLAFFKALLLGTAAAIMYYIFVYCQFTLLIPLIDRLAKSKYKYWGFLISPLEIVIFRWFPLIQSYHMNNFVNTLIHVSCLGWFTYFYLGYMIGNRQITIRLKGRTLYYFWVISIFFQMLEGYWYYTLGNTNCGTQLKLTSILSGVLFVLISYKFVVSAKEYRSNLLKLLGDNSFGIYFSHCAIMAVLHKIGFYSRWVVYPCNAIIVLLLSLLFVIVFKKILGKYGKFLAL